MEDFITNNGEYNYTTFKLVQSEKEIKEKTPIKKFTIIGTEVPENSDKILDVIDTFKSSDNILSTRTRGEIKKAFKAKKIIADEDSYVGIKPYDKKKFTAALGRAI